MSSAVEERLAVLEKRIQELEDEREIRELLSRYGYNADCSREEEYVDLYTEDGILDMVVDGASTRYEGKAALREFISTPREHRKAGQFSRIMHLQGNNTVIHVLKDEAVANMYAVALLTDDNGLRLFAAGNDQWTLNKVSGSWLIKERRLRFIGQDGYTSNLDATPN